VVEQGATVHESVLMPGVRIGQGAYLRRAIVEEGIDIPAGFRAGVDVNQDREVHTITKSGIVVISRSHAGARAAALNFAFNSARRRIVATKRYARAVRLRA
jgi:glucose-1-phosphate adenylyltransferase